MYLTVASAWLGPRVVFLGPPPGLLGPLSGRLTARAGDLDVLRADALGVDALGVATVLGVAAVLGVAVTEPDPRAGDLLGVFAEEVVRLERRASSSSCSRFLRRFSSC